MSARPQHLSPSPPSLLGAAALRYAEHGWPVLPLHAPRRAHTCSCRRDACPKPAKHPRSRNGLRDATTSQAQVRSWWTTWPDANIGIATGQLVVLDVDGAAGYRALTQLQREHAPLPTTLEVITGRGLHLYFDAGPHTLTNSAARLGPGLDVRGRGGYVVAPPSVHADGHRYRWRTRGTPASLPHWLAALLTAPTPPAPRRRSPRSTPDSTRAQRYFNAALRSRLAEVATAPTGARNDTLNRAAFRLAQLAASGLANVNELRGPLLDAAMAAGLSETEAAATIASGLKAGQQHPAPPP
jgi:hypothetical protein